MNVEAVQRAVCKRHGAEFVPSPGDLKLGIALNVRERLLPLNDLRHPPEGDTTGWYVWAGEDLSADPAFFQPLHVKHVQDWSPAICRFLGLAPGWRFMVAGTYEDVWFDAALLNV